MTTEAAGTTEWVFLAGRPPMSEYLGFMSTQTTDGGTHEEAAEDWRVANDRIQELTSLESGICDQPPIRPIPLELEEAVNELRREPSFSNSFGVVPIEFGLIDLDRLIVFQKNINLNYVRELMEALPTAPTTSDLFGFCMTPAGARPKVRAQRVANNAFVFVSPSTDFRFLGPDVVERHEAPTTGLTGHPTSVVTLPVGYGSNYLNVVAANGRLVLNNGSHRAYALYEAGVRLVPAVIQRITRPEELEVVGPKVVHANPDPYLSHPRPPLLKDYFDPILRKVVHTPRRARQVRITFNVETLDVPG